MPRHSTSQVIARRSGICSRSFYASVALLLGLLSAVAYSQSNPPPVNGVCVKYCDGGSSNTNSESTGRESSWGSRWSEAHPHTHMCSWPFCERVWPDDGYRWASNVRGDFDVVPVADWTPSTKHPHLVWINGYLYPGEGYTWATGAPKKNLNVVKIPGRTLSARYANVVTFWEKDQLYFAPLDGYMWASSDPRQEGFRVKLIPHGTPSSEHPNLLWDGHAGLYPAPGYRWAVYPPVIDDLRVERIPPPSREETESSLPSWVSDVTPALKARQGNIPLSFLLGWIAVESEGRFQGPPSSKGERGYFQIHPTEWTSLLKQKEVRDDKLTKEDFEKLTTDSMTSLKCGIYLIHMNARELKRRTGIKESDNPDLFWHLVKLEHSMDPAAVQALIDMMRKDGVQPSSWQAVKDYADKYRPALGFDLQHWIRQADELFEQGRQLTGE